MQYSFLLMITSSIGRSATLGRFYICGVSVQPFRTVQKGAVQKGYKIGLKISSGCKSAGRIPFIAC